MATISFYKFPFLSPLIRLKFNDFLLFPMKDTSFPVSKKVFQFSKLKNKGFFNKWPPIEVS